MDHSKLIELIDLLRSKGVTFFKDSTVELTLGALPNDSKTDLASDDAPQVCPCGHSLEVEHSDAGCLRGCSHDLCNSSTATTPEA